MYFQLDCTNPRCFASVIISHQTNTSVNLLRTRKLAHIMTHMVGATKSRIHSLAWVTDNEIVEVKSSPSWTMFAFWAFLSPTLDIFRQSFFQCHFWWQHAHLSYARRLFLVYISLDFERDFPFPPDFRVLLLPLSINASEVESLRACLSFFCTSLFFRH